MVVDEVSVLITWFALFLRYRLVGCGIDDFYKKTRLQAIYTQRVRQSQGPVTGLETASPPARARHLNVRQPINERSTAFSCGGAERQVMS